jgi:hypothetical protein
MAIDEGNPFMGSDEWGDVLDKGQQKYAPQAVDDWLKEWTQADPRTYTAGTAQGVGEFLADPTMLLPAGWAGKLLKGVR